MRLVFSLCLVSTWGALRDDYCFGGASPNASVDIPPISQGRELKLVQVITRHGARTPITPLPGVLTEWKCSESSLSVLSPNEGQQEINVSRLFRKVYANHASYQNCAFGQLTILGAQQQASIGLGLRSALTNGRLLPNTLDKASIYVRSTDFDRTQLSAQSLLLNLYPPEQSPSGIDLMEINTVTAGQETMIPNVNLCPYLFHLREQALATPEWANVVKKLGSTIDLLEKFMGEGFPQKAKEQADWLEKAADTFSMMECQQNALPPALKEEDRQKLYAAVDFAWFQLYNNSQYSELAMGEFLLDLHRNMAEFVNTTTVPQIKFRLYSGHDTTLAPLLGALGVASPKWIPLASQILVRLLQDSNSKAFFVHILFNGQPLLLPDCSQPECPWSEWEAKMKKIQLHLMKWNTVENICASVAITPPCRDLVSYIRDYATWWPLLVLLILSCFVICGCVYYNRRIQKAERFRPVEMVETSIN